MVVREDTNNRAVFCRETSERTTEADNLSNAHPTPRRQSSSDPVLPGIDIRPLKNNPYLGRPCLQKSYWMEFKSLSSIPCALRKTHYNLGLTHSKAPLGPHTHALLAGLWDELPLTVDAGVGPLPGNALLPLRHIPWGRRASTRILGA